MRDDRDDPTNPVSFRTLLSEVPKATLIGPARLIVLKKSADERRRSDWRRFFQKLMAGALSGWRPGGRFVGGLCRRRLHGNRRPYSGEAAQVLRGRRKQEFVLGAGWPA